MEGKYVKLEDTISWFERIINWEVDEIPEDFFMYKGNIEEVIENYQKDKAERGE
jgi:F-type H+-transporting ATPase subunit beta